MSKCSSLVFKAMAPLAVLGAIAAVPACVSSDSGGDGTAGATSTNGGSTSDGTSTSAAGGTTSVSGTGTTAGGSTAGGVTGTEPVGVACNAISTDAITSFDYDATTATTATEYSFGDYSTTLSGYVYAYGSDLTQTFVDSNWHLQGTTINDYTGFNMQFGGVTCDAAGTCESGNCNLVDASAYTGVTFKIWGSSGGTIKMTVTTASNDITDAWLIACGETVVTPTFGACTPTLAAAAGAKYNQSDCASPSATITLDAGTTASAPQIVTLKWADFTGGKPSVSPNPAKITSMFWNLQWEYTWTTDGGGDPTAHVYSTDITLDDLAFTTT